jgi:cation diffusion facilitator family transporter
MDQEKFKTGASDNNTNVNTEDAKNNKNDQDTQQQWATSDLKTPCNEKEWRLDAKDLLLKFDSSPRNSAENRKNKYIDEYVSGQKKLLNVFIDMDNKYNTSVESKVEIVENGDKNEQSGEMEAKDERIDIMDDDLKNKDDNRKIIAAAVSVSFCVNILLFILKVVISATSGSVSVLASTLDSALDIASGAILYFTTKLKNKKEFYKYPTGKERLEPVGIIIFASVMGVSMIGLLQEVVVRLVMHDNQATTNNEKVINIDLFALSVLVGNVVVKIMLAIFCKCVYKKTNSISVEAYADDHRNDVISNVGVLLAVGITYSLPELWFVDAVFAILVCVYIIYSWYETARDQIRKL